MRKYIRHAGAPFALAAALSLSACTVSDSKSDTSLARDTALSRDLQMAGRDTTVQPQLKDVPATPAAEPAPPAPTPMRTSTPKPAPARTATRPTPKPSPARPTAPEVTASGNTVTRNAPGTSASAAGGGAVGMIASGTSLSLRSNSRVCTNTYTVGQTFTASLANAVSGTNGATIPAGSDVTLEVTNLKRSENVNDKIVMEFVVKSVTIGGKTYPVSGTVSSADVQRVRNEPKNKDAQKVATGAVVGAIAGQIFGRSTKSTIIGAAAGAAAGAGTAAATSNYEGCVPDGGAIAVELSSPLQVRVTS
jgi:hypothetical protein